MNYLAHGWRYASDPYFLAGTAAPDWMNVIDRKVRLRSRVAAECISNDDPELAAVARGIVQHHADDHWFHATSAFAALSLAFAVEIRDALPGDEGFRPSFVGHILVELLLDAALAEQDKSRLDNYYQSLATLDPAIVERAIQRLATRPAQKEEQQGPEQGSIHLTQPLQPGRIPALIPRFIAEQFLRDYQDDHKLLTRLNHIMRRVGLPELPLAVKQLFPGQRQRVWDQKEALLSPTGPATSDGLVESR